MVTVMGTATGTVQPERPTVPKPKVSADRGTRSFGAGLGRKRAL